jgi:putative transcriptional regulator|nr:helix-turn-helix transcriptional regulator [Agrococcus sp. KRD186]
MNRVRDYRKNAGLTQEELAALCGVSRQTIIAVERMSHEPMLTLALRIAAVLRTPLEQMFWLDPPAQNLPSERAAPGA